MTARISRRLHARLDYPLALLLLTSPWILARGADASSLRALCVGTGVLLLAQSLITDYDGGVLPLLPMGVHLLVDVAAGFLLVTAPWMLDVSGDDPAAWLPALVPGALVLASSLLTDDGRTRVRRPRVRP